MPDPSPRRKRRWKSPAAIPMQRALWRLTRRWRGASETAASPPGRNAGRVRHQGRAAAIQTRRATWRAVRPLRRDKAWSFATATGVVGVVLLFLLALSHMNASAAKPTTVAVTPERSDAPQWTAPPPPEPSSAVMELAQNDLPPPEPPDEPTAVEPLPQPDPLPEPSPEPPAMVTESAPPAEPFSPFPPVEPTPPPTEPLVPSPEPLPVAAMAPPVEPAPVAELPPLEIAVARLQLPTAFPDELLAEGQVRPPDQPEAASLPADDWDALHRDRLLRPIKPVLYAERVSPETMQQIRAEIEADVEPAATESARGEARLSIEKTAPRRATVQDAVRYEIVVRNEGETPLERVVVEEHLPAAHDVADVTPAGALDDQTLRWHLRGLGPGEERTLRVQLIPTAEGTARSVASVRSFVSVASNTLVQSARLELAMSAPRHVRQGTVCPIQFTVSNTGPVAATGVVLRDDLPAELVHELGQTLDCAIGTLEPGESRQVQLVVRAETAGDMANRAEVIAEGGLTESAEAPIHVYEPALRLRRLGHRTTPLRETVVYTNIIANESDRVAESVEILETVPPGLEVVKVSGDGTFDPATRTIRWRVPQIEPDGTKRLDVTVRPTETGVQETTVTARYGDEAAAPIMARVEVVPASHRPTVSRAPCIAPPCAPCLLR